MLRSLRRGLKSRQVGLVEINISVNGTNATPAASGPDAFFVDSVVDNGAGNYTIIFKESALAALFVKSIAAITEGAIPNIEAQAVDRVTVNFEDPAGAQIDADFNISLNFPSQLSYYF